MMMIMLAEAVVHMCFSFLGKSAGTVTRTNHSLGLEVRAVLGSALF